MATQMSKDEWQRFLSVGTRTAKLSTVRADGRPHIAPVWFVLDGDDVVFNTGTDTVKGRNLIRDGHIAMCVDNEHPPFDFVVLEGTVRVSEDLTELRDWATRIAARYMGAELAEQFGARNGVPGEMLVRCRPDKVIALSGIAD
ncbi:PPOX class F420-dependent oxidoreductase [Streptomyces iconiensis]|uniref:PPOX class F420-dependent oxidoreductase n=1 Tax=Streptomyces iconiensis TaxID=1384038 RepID=A0ABT6ZNV2_9ACTN|nr:PPOX class F420-dependent oxidoreductase [Streptomyces iconiensis]MDJ1130494.1 PPOX class F420-dependent oxidoreductase [Streptomyces iconiensis]